MLIGMRILILSPFGATEPGAVENLQKVARSDVELEVDNLNPVFPLTYNTWHYNILKCTNGAVERIIKAEKEGYDAVVISCMLDPGLYESRSVVDIPITGTLESSTFTAAMMGRKSAILTCPSPVTQQMEIVLQKYGIRERVASVTHIGIRADHFYPEITPPETLKERTIKVANRCIEEDGAEVIIPGCTILGAVLTKYFDDDMKEKLPIIDPMVVALKHAEMMVDLKKAGYSTISRIGYWKKQPEEEFTNLRKFFKNNKQPEQYYQD